MCRSLVTAAGALLLALLAPGPVGADVFVYPPGSTVAGKTLGEYNSQWWQWAFSFPVDNNPTFDTTGAKIGLGDVGPVFFLAGQIGPSGDPLHVDVTRTGVVPGTKPLFFPLINAEASTLEGNGTTEAELRAAAEGFIAQTIELHASVDGVAIPNLFAHQEESPGLFTITVPDNNIFQFFGLTAPAGTTTNSFADGFYLMLGPLPPGAHVINFGGTVDQDGDPTTTADDFTLNITYDVTVTPEPSTLALFGLAGAGAVAWRRWKRRRWRNAPAT